MKALFLLLVMVAAQECHNEPMALWTSPERLQPYYDLMSKIKAIATESIGDRDCDNGFDGWPRATPHWYRTSGGIYFQNNEFACRFWTPLGSVGIVSDINESIRRFLVGVSAICNLECLAESVRLNLYIDGDSRQIGSVKEHFHRLVCDNSTLELDELYEHASYDNMHVSGRRIFNIISAGKDTF